MQLFSVEQQKSQPLEAHAAAFSTVKVWQGQAPCSSWPSVDAAALLAGAGSRFEVLTFCAVLYKGRCRRESTQQGSSAATVSQQGGNLCQDQAYTLGCAWCELAVCGASTGQKCPADCKLVDGP